MAIAFLGVSGGLWFLGEYFILRSQIGMIAHSVWTMFFVFLIGVIILISRRIEADILQPIEKLEQTFSRILRAGLREDSFDDRDFHREEFQTIIRVFQELSEKLFRVQNQIEEKVRQRTKQLEAVNKQLDEKVRALEQSQATVIELLKSVEDEKNKTNILAKDLEKFKFALEGTYDHIVIADINGVVVYANKSVERITGFSPAEVMGKKMGELTRWSELMGEEFHRKLWQTIRERKVSFSGEIKNRRKNGHVYDAFATISPILNEQGEVEFFVGIERDITREKEIDNAKTEFVSLASHQLRTPLSAINWYVEMLLTGDAGAVTTEQRQYLNEIYQGNKRMAELVNALLNVSRIEMGTFLIDPKPTNAQEIVRQAIEEERPHIDKKKMQVVFDVDSTFPYIAVDPKLFWIVMQNLLSNALKYTPEGGRVTISLAMYGAGETFGARKMRQECIGISVADTGYGIPKEQQDRIFSKLFRADNARAMDTDGTGLGLYMVKSILTASGGSIWFISEENAGTTFFVTLPRGGMKKREGTKTIM